MGWSILIDRYGSINEKNILLYLGLIIFILILIRICSSSSDTSEEQTSQLPPSAETRTVYSSPKIDDQKIGASLARIEGPFRRNWGKIVHLSLVVFFNNRYSISSDDYDYHFVIRDMVSGALIRGSSQRSSIFPISYL